MGANIPSLMMVGSHEANSKQLRFSKNQVEKFTKMILIFCYLTISFNFISMFFYSPKIRFDLATSLKNEDTDK